MKILIMLGIMIFLVSGCAEEQGCNKPYIKIGAECCLDKNSNDICDEHEAAESAPAEIGSICAIDSALRCSDISVTENNIDMTLQNNLGRDIKIHTVVFKKINCKRTFDVNIFSGEKKILRVPCSLSKGGFDSEFTIDYFMDEHSYTKTGEIVYNIE